MTDIRTLLPQRLTAKAFAPYGDVIDADTAKERFQINDGLTTRFHDLAELDLMADAGRPCLSIFRTRPKAQPIILREMECHPLGSQMFFPLSGWPYLVVVAPKGPFLEEQIQVFLADAHQGVNFHAGTWHHYSLALTDDSDFLVIDREGQGENLKEVTLKRPIQIKLSGMHL